MGVLKQMSKNDDMILPLGWFALFLPVFGCIFGIFVKRGMIRKDNDPVLGEGLMFAFILMSTLLGFILSIIGRKIGAPVSIIAMFSNLIVAALVVYFRWIAA